MEFFKFIDKVNYEGPKSRNPFAFKYYDANKIVCGKPMKDHLKFAMSWWHNLGACGVDMFGGATMDKSFGAQVGTMEYAKAKVDAGFEFMTKLGIEYFCFHDVDLVPEQLDINETNAWLDELSDYIVEKQKATGIKCLWGTANMFGNKRYMSGAGSTNNVDVYCFAAAQIKKALEITVKLGGQNYVFWGGREGYETLLNTDMGLEEANIAALMRMAVEYGRKIGLKGDFYIEPKPKEPMKHQYDFDAATSIGFLRKYGLDKDFKLNIEANHAELAKHTFEHELCVSRLNGMLGSIDANEGDPIVGWDVDRFPANVYSATFAMYQLLKSDGLTGGCNFDAKNRRASNTMEDMFKGFILGMDTFALGLLKAAKIIEDGRIEKFVEDRYATWNSPLGLKIRNKETTLEELAARAAELRSTDEPSSGSEEELQGILNSILFTE